MTKVSTKEAAKHVDFSAAHISRLAKLGRVQAERIGRDWFVELESLQDYYNSIPMRKTGRKRKESKKDDD